MWMRNHDDTKWYLSICLVVISLVVGWIMVGWIRCPLEQYIHCTRIVVRLNASLVPRPSSSFFVACSTHSTFHTASNSELDESLGERG